MDIAYEAALVSYTAQFNRTYGHCGTMWHIWQHLTAYNTCIHIPSHTLSSYSVVNSLTHTDNPQSSVPFASSVARCHKL